MGQSCALLQYKQLAEDFYAKGYEVRTIDPDWYKPLSMQIFKVPKNAVIFGFSMGAVLAYLVAKKYPCKKLILASIAPTHTFHQKEFEQFLSTHMEKELATKITKDIRKIRVSLKTLSTPSVTFMGELEPMTRGELVPDHLIPKTTHRITKKYREVIMKAVS